MSELNTTTITVKLKEITDQDVYEALKKFDLEGVGTSFSTKPLAKLTPFARQMYRHTAMDLNQAIKTALKAKGHTWANISHWQLSCGLFQTDRLFMVVCQVRDELKPLAVRTLLSPQLAEELSCIVRL